MGTVQNSNISTGEQMSKKDSSLKSDTAVCVVSEALGDIEGAAKVRI